MPVATQMTKEMVKTTNILSQCSHHTLHTLRNNVTTAGFTMIIDVAISYAN